MLDDNQGQDRSGEGAGGLVVRYPRPERRGKAGKGDKHMLVTDGEAPRTSNDRECHIFRVHRHHRLALCFLPDTRYRIPGRYGTDSMSIDYYTIPNTTYTYEVCYDVICLTLQTICGNDMTCAVFIH